MKETWLNLNKKLEHQQVLNEKLIQQIANEKSENRLGKIVNFEIVGLVLNWGLFLYVLLRFPRLDSLFLQISAIVLFATITLLSYLSYLLYKKTTRIDIQKHQLVEVISSMADFKKYYYNYKKWASVISMIEIIVMVPILIKLIHNSNIFEHFWHFALPISIGLVIGFVLMFWIYKHLYEKNIEAVEMTLEDLKELSDN